MYHSKHVLRFLNETSMTFDRLQGLLEEQENRLFCIEDFTPHDFIKNSCYGDLFNEDDIAYVLNQSEQGHSF